MDTKHAPKSNNRSVKGITVARSILPAIGRFRRISLTDKNAEQDIKINIIIETIAALPIYRLEVMDMISRRDNPMPKNISPQGLFLLFMLLHFPSHKYIQQIFSINK
jgi:hypothetical protein